ncbi:MAG: hypothetical protein DI527_01180 [Chelatococcus sp.]|nr:MAG: hypothetical protein DI527_01180 [Chelatococcus sp.]
MPLAFSAGAMAIAGTRWSPPARCGCALSASQRIPSAFSAFSRASCTSSCRRRCSPTSRGRHRARQERRTSPKRRMSVTSFCASWLSGSAMSSTTGDRPAPRCRTRLASAGITSRAFSRAMRAPPNRFIGELRFRRAQELLIRTELSPADIADCCRFSSQSSFPRAFRRQVGVSPGEFRRKATSWEKARVKPSLPSHTGEAAAGTSRRLRGGSRPRYARHAPRLPSGRWPAPFPSHPAWS